MTEKLRKHFANRFRELLDSGMLRKQAMLQVRDEIRALNPEFPHSKAAIYLWCRKFSVNTR